MKPFTLVAVIFLSIITVMHILRIVTRREILINNWPVPMWLNGIGAVIAGGLAIMLWRENRGSTD